MKNYNRCVSVKRLAALLMSALLLLGMLPPGAFAAQTGSLTVMLKQDTYANLPADPAVEVTLYQIGVAAPETRAGWRINSEFSGYKVLEAKTVGQLADIADEMAGDIVGSEYTGTPKALSQGSAKFPDLQAGVYLGVLTGGPEGLEVDPFIVTVPSRDPETKEMRYDYDVTLKDKCVTYATVRKVWNDNEDQDGMRPKSLKVSLSNGTSKISTVALNAGNEWQATVDNLPRYYKGNQIAYSWAEEDLPEGYALSGTAVDGVVTTLTNVHTPQTTSVAVRKVWDDADDQDGARPKSLTVALSDGTLTVGTVTLNDANNWQASIDNLPKYAAGEEIAYSWSEQNLPEGYALKGTAADGAITTLTNAYVPKTTTATVRKVWNDNDDQDGIRPQSLTAVLLGGSTEVDTVTLNAANGWTATVTDLPVYSGGVAITYSWTERDLPEGYTLTGNTAEGTITTLTNSHTPETTSATVRKVWDDNGDQDGIRPQSLTVTLVSGTVSAGTVVLNAENNWTATIDNLPKYSDGKQIAYSWSEQDLPEGYVLTGIATEGTITTLTNSHTPQTTSATVRKVWRDDDNRDGVRPQSLTVTLTGDRADVRDVVLNAANRWTATIDNLPKYSGGVEIAYGWTEKNLPDGYYLTGIVTDGTITTLTNSHTPETTSATVRKVWDDSDNQDGVRPQSLTVTLSNGAADIESVTLDAANGWTATIDNLPRYSEGTEISYVWTEDGLPDGYVLTGTVTDGTITTLTNSYTPGETAATVRKVWNDDDNRDGIRPQSLTVTLSNGTEDVGSVTLDASNNWVATISGLPRNSGGTAINYSWTEKDLPEGYALTGTAVNGTVTTLTNSHTPETTSATVRKVWRDNGDQDGVRPAKLTVALSDGTANIEAVELNAANGWTATVDNLPKYFAGVGIIYSWIEQDLPEGYTLANTATEGTITTLTNRHAPETTSATVRKVWNDDGDQDGIRPAKLTVALSDGAATIAMVELDAANGWTATLDNLPKYSGGSEIAYRWTEEGLPEGYALTGTAVDGTVTTLTNSHTPGVVSATVRKVWDDQDGIRPASLTVALSDGTANIGSVTLDAANNWTATIENLPKYSDGREISYTWTEESLPEGYTLTNTAVEGAITTLTNSHAPETTSATVRKAWRDNENQDGVRPQSLTVALTNGANKVGSVTLDAANDWTATLENLPKYSGGVGIAYAWTEEDLPEGYVLTGIATEGTITTLTNSYTPEATAATVRKVWNDADDQDGIRPASLTVALTNGAAKVGTVTLDAANNWTATIDNLPKYSGGAEIAYSWTEEDLPEGYALTGTAVEGTVTALTNSHAPETTSATVRKVWNDSDDQDGIRPASLTVALTNGAAKVASVTLDAANNWTATIENLPKYSGGREIGYAWTEEDLPEGYALTGIASEGTVTTLTNSHAPETVSATVRKLWDDGDDQDGIRPAALTVVLKGDAAVIETVALNAASGWTATVDGLPKYSGGAEIAYEWSEEDLPEGYALTGTAVDGAVTTLTNSHVPETTSATVRKVWRDNDNQDGVRPASLTVTLMNGAQSVGTVALNGENNWTATIGGLPKRSGGREIAYYWIEGDMPEGYVLTGTAIEGTVTTLTNSYAPQTTAATVRKVWDDNDDQDGIRPASLTVTLTGDAASIETVTLNEANGWTATIGDLPKFSGGVEIAYGWVEGDLPEGYALTGIASEGTITTLTNSHAPETVSATVRKLWDDNDDQDGIRPASLTVALSNGTANIDAVALNAANNWTATVDGLPKYSGGSRIAYSWIEQDLPEGYALTNTAAEGTITTLTNTHVPETTSATVRKVWLDRDDQDGVRPASLTVALLGGSAVAGEATLNAANNWTATIDGLPKYSGGSEIDYSWMEKDLPEGYALTGYAAEGAITTLSNSYMPQAIAATVRKVWDDADDRDGIRPASLTVKLSDGTAEVGAVTLDAANNWTATIGNLPMYSGGVEIAYGWSEEGLPEGYALTGTAVNGTITTLTNSHAPETVYATVRKVWDDQDDQDGVRPASLTVKLSSDSGTVGTVALNEANGWTGTIDNLPKYSGGVEIAYSWAEENLPEGYALYNYEVADAAEGAITTLTNRYVPKTTAATVRKVWSDSDDQDGLRPENLSVTLTNGTTNVGTVTLNAANNWTATLDALPMYSGGEALTYRWVEDSMPTGYALTNTSVEGTVTTLTNSHTPGTTSATVRKVWNDYNDQDNIRPASLRVALSNGTANVGAVTLSDANGWQASINDLPVYANGARISYTWSETNLPAGYTLTGTNTDGTVTTLTNSHTPEKPIIEISGQKIWVDENDVHKLRPESITVQLYADGVLVNATPTWRNTGSDSNTWSYSFGNLPEQTDGGAKIQYKVQELPVEGYEGTISGTTITNKLIPRQPKEYKEISGVKTWVDDENAGGTRPNYIIVHLLRDGAEIASRTVTVASGWAYTFGMQPVDDGYGHIYQYEIREDGVPGYFCRIDGMNLINTSLSRTPGKPDNPTPNNPDSPFTPTGRRIITRKTATPRPKYEKYSVQELAEMFDLFDYGTPLWGTLLGTGDETPIYPFIFGGVGVAAVIALLVFGRKRKKRAK